MSTPIIGIGLLGCGTVGSALVQHIQRRHDELQARLGIDLRVVRIGVRDLERQRGLGIDASLFTTDLGDIVHDPNVDVVVELMGGIEPARSHIIDAIAAGKPVVTANKALLAEHGRSLFDFADKHDTDLFFEAAVAGGIPLIRALRQSLAGEPLTRLMGIVNGTTNFILTEMDESGAEYEDALAEAQELGYAEADPTADVEGHDAAAKAAILAAVGFGASPAVGDVHTDGIANITSVDIAFADRLGYVVKLLAVVEHIAGRGVAARVHPAMLPVAHPLASVRGAFNAVFIEGSEVGELMLYGRGAGGEPTASAVLGDIIDAARNRSSKASAPPVAATGVAMVPLRELANAFYLNLQVLDQPGVLAAVAGVFGRHDVSIRSMEQIGLGDEASLVFITHVAGERNMTATLDDLRALDAVKQVGSVIRVIGVQ